MSHGVLLEPHVKSFQLRDRYSRFNILPDPLSPSSFDEPGRVARRNVE